MANIFVIQREYALQQQPSGVDMSFNFDAWGKTSTGGLVNIGANYLVSETSIPDFTPNQLNNAILDIAQTDLVAAGAEPPGLLERRMLMGPLVTILL